MADSKRTRPSKRQTSRIVRFPEVRGKIVQAVEVDDEVEVISILFDDKTILSFDLDRGLTVFPELSDYKTGNWKPIKRWPAVRSSESMVKWP